MSICQRGVSLQHDSTNRTPPLRRGANIGFADIPLRAGEGGEVFPVSWTRTTFKEPRAMLYASEHPLVRLKVAELRDAQTRPPRFRELVREISMLLGYEALRSLP